MLNCCWPQDAGRRCRRRGQPRLFRRVRIRSLSPQGGSTRFREPGRAMSGPIPMPSPPCPAPWRRRRAQPFQRDGNRCFDTSPVMDADGKLLACTRIIHITDYEGFHEQDYYTPGDTRYRLMTPKLAASAWPIPMTAIFPNLRELALGAPTWCWCHRRDGRRRPEGLYEAEVRVAAFQTGYFIVLCNLCVGMDAAFQGWCCESFVCWPVGIVLHRAAGWTLMFCFADLDLAAVEQVLCSARSVNFAVSAAQRSMANWLLDNRRVRQEVVASPTIHLGRLLHRCNHLTHYCSALQCNDATMQLKALANRGACSSSRRLSPSQACFPSTMPGVGRFLLSRHA